MGLEFRRQLFHIFFGLIMIFLYYIDVLNWIVLAVVLVGCYGLYFLLKKGYFPHIKGILHYFDREDQFMPAWGAFTFVKGFLVACLLFPKDIALSAMIILTFGDGFSTLVGVHFGRHKLPWDKKKSYEGFLAGLLTSFLGALLFVSPLLAFFASFVGMIVESVKKPHVIFDDNMLIPLCVGAFMLLFTVFF